MSQNVRCTLHTFFLQRRSQTYLMNGYLPAPLVNIRMHTNGFDDFYLRFLFMSRFSENFLLKNDDAIAVVIITVVPSRCTSCSHEMRILTKKQSNKMQIYSFKSISQFKKITLKHSSNFACKFKNKKKTIQFQQNY